jgi:radical SAM protein with 4Fe4S-binding SPASM domain
MDTKNKSSPNCGLPPYEKSTPGLSRYMTKIINAKELRCQNRQPLQELIPLSTPFVVFIEPTNLCNLRCVFCPTSDKKLLSHVGRPAGMMPMKLFEKIVKDLSEFESPTKKIHLYKDGEPLLHRNLTDMLTLLKQSQVTERIWLKTNGSLLNPELNERLISTGIDWIGISVEAVDAEGYSKVSGVRLDYKKFVDNIRDLFQRRRQCVIYIKIVDVNLKQEDKDKFYHDFMPISDYCAVENLMGLSYTDSKDFMLGTTPDTQDGLPLVEKQVCPYPFYEMCVNFNGDVSVCCADWAHQTVVGNVNNDSLKGIWHGPRMNAFRIMQLEHRRFSNRACGNCHYIKTVPDILDGFEAVILDKLKSQ